MKIRIHRGFRAVLSVLVTVMLLVGVMPSSVWNGISVQADDHFIVYFDKERCGVNYGDGPTPNYNNGDDTPIGIYFWGGGNTTPSLPVAMQYLDGSYESTGHHIFKYDFEANPPEGIIFTAEAGTWTDQTKNITGK